jgi:hypothetical protein
MPTADDISDEHARAEAANWQDACFAPGDPGYCRADEADWHYDPAFPVAALAGDAWAAWFADECADAAADGRTGYYDDMLDREISEPIVVLLRDGAGYVWDGNHRVGATVTQGRSTIKAFVGSPMHPLSSP